MSIEKIEIKETIWERTTNEEGKSVHKIAGYEMITHTREDYQGNFDRFILGELDNYDIQDYAESSLGMIDEDDVEVDNMDISDFRDAVLISELKGRGYEIIKCATISESLKLQKVKELMEL